MYFRFVLPVDYIEMYAKLMSACKGGASMIIKKWLPCSMWDFIGLQNWINEQAAEGYALMDWPGAWDIGRISFQEDPSASAARYRLEPMDDRIGERERNELYAQSGWK